MVKYVDRAYCPENGLYRPEDRKFEDMCQEKIERLTKAKLHRFPEYESADFYAERDGKIVAIVEVRNRSISYKQYPDIYFPVYKYEKLMALSAALSVPMVLVLGFTDGLLWLDLRKHPDLTMGEAVRNHNKVQRKSDREPAVMVPVSKMKELK